MNAADDLHVHLQTARGVVVGQDARRPNSHPARRVPWSMGYLRLKKQGLFFGACRNLRSEKCPVGKAGWNGLRKARADGVDSDKRVLLI